MIYQNLYTINQKQVVEIPVTSKCQHDCIDNILVDFNGTFIKRISN